MFKPNKRGRKPKAALSQKECEVEDDMFKPNKRGCKPKTALCQNDNNIDNRVIKRRGKPKALLPTRHVTEGDVLSKPKKRKNVSSASAERSKTDWVNTSDKPKRKLYSRESKAKGKQFIKVVIGKHKTVNSNKRGKKIDLESELKDIDVMLDEMKAGDKCLTEDSTVKVVDLNKQDDMQVKVTAIDICTFANSSETNTGKEIVIKGENVP